MLGKIENFKKTIYLKANVEWIIDQAPEEFFYATLARVNQSLAENFSVVVQGM